MNEDNYNNFFESLFGASQASPDAGLKEAAEGVFNLFQTLMSSGFTSSEAIQLIGTTLGTMARGKE